MSDKPKGPLGKILGMANDSIPKTLFVAICLCLVCSVVVSMAAVALKPLQISNKLLDKQRNILTVAGILKEGETRSIDELFEQVETRVVNLETGEYVEGIDITTYDQRRAASDSAQNVVIPSEKDIASVRRRAQNAFVYLVKGESNEVEKVIIPVHGYGLWSTLYGFIA
ncbi:MAG: Na(+)-translocating NADH-quinone reductase subunit C, partial [Pseudomonadota bacterium]